MREEVPLVVGEEVPFRLEVAMGGMLTVQGGQKDKGQIILQDSVCGSVSSARNILVPALASEV